MSTSMVQRSAGSSAVAHAAYVSRSIIVDERTGQQADYTRRDGVEAVAPAIVVPAEERETASSKIERGQLWNMAEAAEKRKDGTPARKVLVALPHELGAQERLALTQQYAQWMADRYHVAVDFAVHKPDAKGDQRNFHAHMILTTRELRNGQLADKAQLEWTGSKLKERGLPGGRAMVHELRERWEDLQNAALKQHAPQVELVSCKSLVVQREAKLAEAGRLEGEGRGNAAVKVRLKAIELDRTPQQHVGWAANAMERRLDAQKERLAKEGKPTDHLPAMASERGAQRRQLQKEHRGVAKQIREWYDGFREWLKEQRQQIAAAAAVSKPIPTPAPAKLAATREEHWKGLAGEERIKEYTQLVAWRDQVVGYLEKETARAAELKVAIQWQEERSWWKRDRAQLSSDKDLLAKIEAIRPGREEDLAKWNPKIAAYEKEQKQAFEQYGELRKAAFDRELIVLDLKKQHVELLIAAEYPNDAQAQMERFAKGEKVLIRGERAVLHSSEHGLHVSLQRQDQKPLEKQLSELMPKVIRQPQRSRQKSRDFERG